MTATTAADTPFGLEVALPDRCRGCGAHQSIVTPGKGPHLAGYYCAFCGANRGWMSSTTYEFLVTVIKEFGRPDKPITVTRKANNAGTAALSPVQTVTASASPSKGDTPSWQQ